MILPIVGYGSPILRKQAEPLAPGYPDLKELVANMYDTMHASDGIGLAAPQIDRSIQLIVIGLRHYDEKTDTYGDTEERHTLINPEILESKGEMTYFNEGCLSVPGIHEDVLRPEGIVVRYLDEDFVEHTEEMHGMLARVAQHEIDHLHGKVFTDRLGTLRKSMLHRRMSDIANGKVQASYKMKFAKKR